MQWNSYTYSKASVLLMIKDYFPLIYTKFYNIPRLLPFCLAGTCIYVNIRPTPILKISLFAGIRSWSRIAPPIHLSPLYRGLRARSRSMWPLVVKLIHIMWIIFFFFRYMWRSKLLTGEDDSRFISGGSKSQRVVISSVGGWRLLYLENAWKRGRTV